jgi:hypothetical protein
MGEVSIQFTTYISIPTFFRGAGLAPATSTGPPAFFLGGIFCFEGLGAWMTVFAEAIKKLRFGL